MIDDGYGDHFSRSSVEEHGERPLAQPPVHELPLPQARICNDSHHECVTYGLDCGTDDPIPIRVGAEGVEGKPTKPRKLKEELTHSYPCQRHQQVHRLSSCALGAQGVRGILWLGRPQLRDREAG